VIKLRENEQVVAIIGGTVGVTARYFPVLRFGEAGAFGIVAGRSNLRDVAVPALLVGPERPSTSSSDEPVHPLDL
jgi:hypothetical protein